MGQLEIRSAARQSLIIGSGCDLRPKDGQLEIKKDGIKNSFSFDFLETLVLSSGEISVSTALLDALMEKHVRVVMIDRSKKPSSVVLPLMGGRSVETRFESQIAWDRKRKDALWLRIVENKIRNQSAVLKENGMTALPTTKSGVSADDCDFLEAKAAKLYFSRLLGSSFCRRDDANPINAALNYGYAIILSSVAQDIVALGYHPFLGIHHHAATNPLNLASDLMEPFRPTVDRLVKESGVSVFDSVMKKKLVSVLDCRYSYRGRKQSLQDIITSYVKDCLSFVSGNSERMPRFDL
jgi:CRISPR-associated protein Cas1